MTLEATLTISDICISEGKIEAFKEELYSLMRKASVQFVGDTETMNKAICTISVEHRKQDATALTPF